MLQITRQHGHYRPDMVTRTSVIEPYDIQRVSPVHNARHTIDPFIYGIRPPGPQVAPVPSSAAIANAASAVADGFRAGKSVVVSIGRYSAKVSPGQPPPGGWIGKIVEAANGILTGKPVVVKATGSDAVVVQDSKAPQAQMSGAGGGVATSYPSTYEALMSMKRLGPTGSIGPITPGYARPFLGHRTVPNWYQAGRSALRAAAAPYRAPVPGVVTAARKTLNAMRKMGL